MTGMRRFITWSALVVAGVVFAAIAHAQSNRETPVVKIVRDNKDAVVNISTEKIVFLRGSPAWGAFGDELDAIYGQFYGSFTPVQALKLKSAGSGVILGKDGVIVTNAHVVNMTTNIIVILNDGAQARGEVVYEDASSDLALIKISTKGPLKEVKLGRTDDIMIGETCVAIGNPFGLENSVSAGVVSGKNRSFYDRSGDPVISGLIQTDAPINMGNSGGALLNIDGELIGINVAVMQDAQSIGFAMPVEKVKSMLDAYRNNPGRGPVYLQPGIKQIRINRAPRQKTDSFGLEDKGAYYEYKMDIKGLDKKSLDIEVNKGSMTVRGQKIEESDDKSLGVQVISKSVSSFSRTIPLPNDVNIQKAATDVKGDTLVITLPKRNGK